MKKIITSILLLCFLALPMLANAQEVAMADKFREEGKIYVVIAVFAVILTGLFVYVFFLDRKINKLEKEEKQ